MISMDFQDPELPHEEMAALTKQVRVMTRRLSRDQILDIADLLHDTIRERQVEARSWRRLHTEAVSSGPLEAAAQAPLRERASRPASIAQQA